MEMALEISVKDSWELRRGNINEERNVEDMYVQHRDAQLTS